MPEPNTSRFPAEQIVRGLGLILSNCTVYGPEHSVTKQSVESCYQQLQPVLAQADVSINFSEDDFIVNHVTVEQKNALIKHLAQHLEAREIGNFTIKQAITGEQFAAFMEVLSAQPAELEQLGQFSGAIAAVGLSDVIVTRKVIYREVNEDEVVVGKEDLSRLEESAVAGEGSQGAKAETVVAFLRGDVVAGDEDAAKNVRDLGADADQLAELIMHSAQVRESEVNLEQGESLGDLVVGCLARAYQALTDDPSFNTKKTKKQIHKTLLLLEHDLLERLHALGEQVTEKDETAVKEALESMEDDLQIDALTQEFVKKRNAADTSEKRILRYIKSKGAEKIEESDLKTRLVEGGMDADEWHELLVKSGVVDDDKPSGGSLFGIGGGGGFDGGGGGAGGGDGGLGALGDLAKLLEKIESDTGKQPADAAAAEAGAETETGQEHAADDTAGVRAVMLRVPEDVFEEDLHSVHDEINKIILRTEKRIEKLVEEVGGGDKEEAEQDDDKPPRISRKRLFEILAEIGQELCQPLAVINCSIDMIKGGNLGEVNKLQADMLEMALDSGAKMKQLVDKIITIAGVPDDLVVNKDIQTSLYE